MHLFNPIALQYKHLFIDLDDTVYDFTGNSRDTFAEVFSLLHYERFFSSFDEYFSIYMPHNTLLWARYGDGDITKEELNRLRFLYPLEVVEAPDAAQLAAQFCQMALERIPRGRKLMPHAKEALLYLQPRYHLYALTNGFRELLERKMRSAEINHFFEKIILSEDIGVNKPHAPIFEYAFEVTGAAAANSLMIGDHFEVDIEGAAGVGMDQVYYNHVGRKDLPFRPTYEIVSLEELKEIL